MTSCIDPCELEEGALSAFLENPHDARTAAHLARRPHCAAQVAAYRQTLALLETLLYRQACPAVEMLALYQLNLTTPVERLVIAAHVRDCPHCQRELDELAQNDDTSSLFDRLRQGVGVLIAAPVSTFRQPATSLRGETPPLLRFRAGDLEIHLSQQPGHSLGQRTLLGRLTSLATVTPPEPGTEIWLWRSDFASATVIEADGIFTFENVEPGQYSLGLEWQGTAVSVPEVEIV
ncbi:MAG: zf-HC2 domain-containing protein [Anaerolineae bacterium]|nr:zf-HC2 domain-containing protein [Anaerolineae bacterium]